MTKEKKVRGPAKYKVLYFKMAGANFREQVAKVCQEAAATIKASTALTDKEEKALLKELANYTLKDEQNRVMEIAKEAFQKNGEASKKIAACVFASIKQVLSTMVAENLFDKALLPCIGIDVEDLEDDEDDGGENGDD